jgi:hypothetical protein
MISEIPSVGNQRERKVLKEYPFIYKVKYHSITIAIEWLKSNYGTRYYPDFFGKGVLLPEQDFMAGNDWVFCRFKYMYAVCFKTKSNADSFAVWFTLSHPNCLEQMYE